MRAILLVLCLAACGSGGEGPVGGGAAGFQGEAGDFLTLLANEPPVTVMTAAPRGQVSLRGGAGARLGWSDEALLGVAEAVADFDAALLSGRIHDMGIYSVPTDAPLMQSAPLLLRPLEGQVTFAGTISPPRLAGEGVSFALDHAGTLRGTGPAQDEQWTVAAQTPQGAFLSEDGVIHAYGQMDGTVTLAQPDGGHGVVQTLREGRIFMVEP